MIQSTARLYRRFLLPCILLVSTCFPVMAQEGDTLLAVAAREGDLAAVRSLLEGGADPNHGFEHFTPLMLAAMNGQTEIARILIDRGARVSQPDSENGTALCVASFTFLVPEGDPDGLVRLLLESGAETELGNGSGMTPLMYAAREGKQSTVRLLLEAGANADHRDVRGWSPLMFAVRSANPEIVRMILQAGADPNVPTDYPVRRPMHYAAGTGNVEVAGLLLDAGADINGFRTSEEVPPPIAIAALEGYDEFVRYLLEQGADLNRSFLYYPPDGLDEDEYGAMTLLDVVQKKGTDELAQEIRDAGGIGYRELQTLVADMHGLVAAGDVAGLQHALRLGLDPAAYIEVGGESTSLLNVALASGDTAVARVILESTDLGYWDVSILLEDQLTEGRTEMVDVIVRHTPAPALIYAIDITDERIFDLALANVTPEEISGFRARDIGTAMNHAVVMGDAVALERLVDAGVPVDVVDDNGNTPLHSAVENDNLWMAEWLLDHGADPENVNKYRETPLILATRRGSGEVIPLLLDRGARPDRVDLWGNSPLHYLASTDQVAEVELLLSRGGIPSARNVWGESPADIARLEGSPEVEELLGNLEESSE